MFYNIMAETSVIKNALIAVKTNLLIGKFSACFLYLISMGKQVLYLEKMELLFLSSKMPIVWVITRKPMLTWQ